MYYLPIHFNGSPVNALLDTGSVVTVVTQNFLQKEGHKLSPNLPAKKILTANGQTE